MKDEIFDKLLSTLSKEELVGMYAIISKREVEYLKEIKVLRLSLQSHGQIVDMNAELKEENARLREVLETIANIDTSKDFPDLLWLNSWRNNTKELARKALERKE